MTGRKALVVTVVLAALSGGCGTIDNIRRPVYPPPNGTNAKVCRIYGGVRGDFGVMTEYPWRNPPSVLDYVVIPAMAVVDLGLSTIGDTFTLPLTVGVEVWRMLYPNKPAPNVSPVTVVEPAAIAPLVPEP